MNKSELIKGFVLGYVTGTGSNLYIVGRRLINYSTTIAYRVSDTIILNAQKYSVTTSKNQNIIKREATARGIKVIEIPDEISFYKYLEMLIKEDIQ